MGQMLAAGIPADKLCCVPNGVDCSEIEAVPGEGDYCLYLGRLSEEKGLRTLLAAMKDAPAQLRIVGDGPEAPALQAYARSLGLSNVSFEGKKSGPELRDQLRNAAFVVVPSEWYENASMSVLEAMAFGKPVIASRIGGLPSRWLIAVRDFYSSRLTHRNQSSHRNDGSGIRNFDASFAPRPPGSEWNLCSLSTEKARHCCRSIVQASGNNGGRQATYPELVLLPSKMSAYCCEM